MSYRIVVTLTARTDAVETFRWVAEQFRLERFSFVLRTSWAWAGSTIPQAPKERKFIACGRQPQDPETHQKKLAHPAFRGVGMTSSSISAPSNALPRFRTL